MFFNPHQIWTVVQIFKNQELKALFSIHNLLHWIPRWGISGRQLGSSDCSVVNDLLTCSVSLLGCQHLLQSQDLLLSLLQLRLPLLPLSLLLLRTQLLEISANHRISGRVDVLQIICVILAFVNSCYNKKWRKIGSYNTQILTWFVRTFTTSVKLYTLTLLFYDLCNIFVLQFAEDQQKLNYLKKRGVYKIVFYLMLTKIRTFLRHTENVKYDLHLMTQQLNTCKR